MEISTNQPSADSRHSSLSLLLNWFVNSLDSLKVSEALKLDTRLRTGGKATNELNTQRNYNFH